MNSSKFNIQVALRIRPFLDEYDDKNDRELVIGSIANSPGSDKQDVMIKGSQETFQFDQLFWSHDGYEIQENGYFSPKEDKYVDQNKLFQKYGTQVVGYALEGFNTCLVAYGQTCSGKSYSMFGDNSSNTGIITLAAQDLFKKIDSLKKKEDDFSVKVQMLEIYHSRVQDLLIEPNDRPKNGLKVSRQPKVDLIDGITNAQVQTADDLLNIINLGIKNKAVGCTLFNKQSSRSHTIIRIEVTQKAGQADGQMLKSVITLVDLPGREKLDDAQNQKDQLADSWSINKGLLGLENVVEAIVQSQGTKSSANVQYEQTNLTTILQDALGGNCKTYFLCNIQPGTAHANQTLKTLQFAKMLRKIENSPSPVVDVSNFSAGSDDESKAAKFYLSVGKQLSDSYLSQVKKEQAVKGNKGGCYLLNLNKDPLLDRKAFYSIEESTSLTGGRRFQDKKHTLQIGLTCISKDHVEFKMQKDGKVTIKPLYPAESDQLIQQIYVNGKEIKGETVLKAGDRIWLGSAIFFQFDCVSDKKSMAPEWSYWMANKEAVQAINMTEMKEVLTQIGDDLKKSNMLTNQSLGSSDQSKKLMEIDTSGQLDDVEQFITNQMETIENIKQQQMTKELSKILGQNADNDYQTVQIKLDNLIPLVKEANMASKELKRNIIFSTKLAKKYNKFLKKDKVYPIIVVDNKEEKYKYEWTEQNFKFRMQKIRELLEVGFIDQPESKSDDPFWDPPQLFKLGYVQVSLQPLIYGLTQILNLEISNDEDPSLSFDGVAYLNVKIQPCSSNGVTRPELIPDKFAVEDYRKLIGLEDMYFKVTVVSATGLPISHCQESCVQYHMDYEVPKCEYWTHRVRQVNQDPMWSTSNVHHIPLVTQEIAQSLNTGKINFSIYALQSTVNMQGDGMLQEPATSSRIKKSIINQSQADVGEEDDLSETSGTQIWDMLSPQNVITATTVTLVGTYLVYKVWGRYQ